MGATLTANIIYGAFLIFLAYFIGLILFYLLLAVMGLFEEKKRAWEKREEDYSTLYLSAFTIPVSIVIPAHNEEEWIRDCVLSALNLNYPNFEVIVVDDGSKDRTLYILDETLGLYPIDTQYVKHYKGGQVRTIFKSAKYPNVKVISKSAGLKKAGAMNAGLNIAESDYICAVDADTVLEPNALLDVMIHVAKEPDKVIGIGSYFGLSNGLTMQDGRITKHTFSWNPLVAYQNVEYLRSFFGNRIAWSAFNAMPTIAGGFGVWRRDVLYELGGYSSEFTCEDIELTFRAHDYIAKNKEKDYKILMLPYYVGWTEGPSNIPSLISQRDRWQRVTNETIWRYKYMLCNPKYKSFAFMTLPYLILYEVFGVFFEVASIAFVAWGWLSGVLDLRTFIAFLILMILSQTFISLVSIFTFMRGQKVFRLGYVSYLIFLSFVEFLVYRWIISIAKLLGMINSIRGVKTFDQYARAKR